MDQILEVESSPRGLIPLGELDVADGERQRRKVICRLVPPQYIEGRLVTHVLVSPGEEK